MRHVLGKGLRDAGEGILDAGPGLGGEHAVALAAFDARIAVGDADADALLPAENRTNIERGARLDQGIARIAGEKLGSLALEDFGNDVRRRSCACTFQLVEGACDDRAACAAPARLPHPVLALPDGSYSAAIGVSRRTYCSIASANGTPLAASNRPERTR